MKRKFDSVKGFEMLDVRFYSFKVHKKENGMYAKWMLEPSAQPIKLKGFDNLSFYIIKRGDRMWKISEALSGMYVYASKDSESKANAISNCLNHLEESGITPEKMTERVVERINQYGVSIKYRS